MSKRRQNGEGTIYQRKNGLWVYEYTAGYDKENKRIKKTMTSMDLEALQKKINTVRYESDRGIIKDAKNLTLNEWIDMWLQTYQKGNVKPTTYDGYIYAWQGHIKDDIGNYRLDKINQISIQAFVNKLARDGLSLSTVKRSYIVINQAMKKAVSNNLIHINPCFDINFPKSEPKQVVAMTIDEQAAFEKYCPDTTYGRLFLFALYTGMRVGEILALMWDDVDMGKRDINVKNNIVLVRDDDEKSDRKTRHIIQSAKTQSGIRTIPMSDKAFDVLSVQRAHEQNETFCFSSKAGTPIEKRNIRRALELVVERANIQTHVTMHVLRHTFATRLLERGANIKAVSEILGHKNIQITLDTYSHVLDDFKSDTIKLLN